MAPLEKKCMGLRGLAYATRVEKMWSSLHWTVPSSLHECDDSRTISKESCFVAYGSIEGAEFTRVPLVGVRGQGGWMSDTKWEDLRWDYETAEGESSPYDMLFAFQVLSATPMFRKGGLARAMERIIDYEWKEGKSLQHFKRLKGSDAIVQGSWILIVGLQWPWGGRNTIPFNRRRDVLRYQVDVELAGSKALRASERLGEIRKSLLFDVHPADCELRTLPNGWLFSKQKPTVACGKCGARGHHTTQSHEHVYEDACREYTHHTPPWLSAPPLEDEVLVVPIVEDGKGFELLLRNVTARVPLRMARAMKLAGMDIEGDVHACGVQEKAGKPCVDSNSCCRAAVEEKSLYMPGKCPHKANHNAIACCCCAAVTAHIEANALHDMLTDD